MFPNEDFKLTKRQREVLQALADDDNLDLVFAKGGGWWLGNERTNGKLALSLIRLVLVNDISDTGDDLWRFTINDSGKRALAGIKPIYELGGNDGA